jgi:hypothetical protein
MRQQLWTYRGIVHGRRQGPRRTCTAYEATWLLEAGRRPTTPSWLAMTPAGSWWRRSSSGWAPAGGAAGGLQPRPAGLLVSMMASLKQRVGCRQRWYDHVTTTSTATAVWHHGNGHCYDDTSRGTLSCQLSTAAIAGVPLKTLVPRHLFTYSVTGHTTGDCTATTTRFDVLALFAAILQAKSDKPGSVSRVHIHRSRQPA